MEKINFASDNYSGISPSVLETLSQVNTGPAIAYGSDEITKVAEKIFESEFGTGTQTFFVWNGTAANVLSLQAMTRSFEAVICSDVSHIHKDECGAPEAHLGSKLVLLPTRHGKINIEDVKIALSRKGDVHAVQPKVLSLTQTTEYGTVYSISELENIIQFAHQQGLWVHMDGARLSNAAVALGVSFKALTRDLGVDVLSFGGTKNGLMGAEAVVILNPRFQESFGFLRKQGMHLASKMRYVSAQFIAYFDNQLWKRNAEHSNKMAALLAEGLRGLGDKVKFTQPVQANAVFCSLSPDLILRLQEKFSFYVWDEVRHEIRLMCTFQTTPKEIEAFLALIEEIWS